MKKYLLFVLVSIMSFVETGAQDWVALLSSANGLPGILTTTTSGEYYSFTSPTYNLGSVTTDKVRLTVIGTYSGEMPNGNNYTFALSELKIYDGSGNEVSYSASSNADHNTLFFFQSDGGGLDALSDNDYTTYFHSMWQSYNAVSDYHYVELSLAQSLSQFSVEWGTRMNQPKNAPTKVALTLGTDYEDVGTEFELGAVATDLSADATLFVLRSNTVTSFTTSDGTTYTGNGSEYMTCAEKGTSEASFDNVVQLLPSGDGGYFVYWTGWGVYLKNSGDDYNGKNGWQYSTYDINEAAVVSFTQLDNGDYEMYYTSTYNVIDGDNTEEVTDILYIGADMRDNTSSKMKTFAPDKKEALDKEDYTQGYSLPIAFNWSIYEAGLSETSVQAVSLSMQQIAYSILNPLIQSANEYILTYGDFDGGCTGGELSDLGDAISAAEALLQEDASPTMNQINTAKATLTLATNNYIICGLDIYEARIDSIMETAEFSSYPYVTGTYPTASRSILENLQTTIADAKTKTDTYTAEQYIALYEQLDTDIARFQASKITYINLPTEYTTDDGLPGTLASYGGYEWETPFITLNSAVTGVRLTFTEINTPADNYIYEGYPMISLGELELYDGNGNQVTLSESNFATNSQELSEGPMANICDGDYSSFYHSIWQDGTMSPVDYVYIDVTFPSAMSAFTIKLYGRANATCSPTAITMSALGGSSVDNTIVEGAAFYVYLADGGVDAYSTSDIDGDYYTQGEYLCFPLVGGGVIYYTAQEYDSVSVVAPALPELKSFKFNNKYNPNLNVDVEAETISGNIYLSLNSIGKWLTASFQTTDDKAVVYVDTVLQESKVTRQSFATPKTYTVTYPGYNKVGATEVDEEWNSSTSATEITLTSDMLDTNKPSVYDDESVASLLDGDASTYFHSTWGSDNNATIDVATYLTVDLPQPVENIQLYYQCREKSGYAPLTLEIYAGNGNDEWTLVRTLTSTDDNLPTGTGGAEYTSPAIALGAAYSYLKILQTSGENSKNHMALAELRIYEVVTDSTLVREAGYETTRVPFGNNYTVDIEWLTDNAVSVPRIDIDIDGGATVTSKEYYLGANFRITGYGVYDDFEDSVKIKGRGNTSWSHSKKPYRLKFAKKVKPFGLTKGKSWVLLANAQTNSMMANAVAMKIGQMANAEYANHIIPVELYMNGVYKGSYMFTEKVGISNNSVDIDDELGYLLELDSYYDEDYKFRSSSYNNYVNIKDPDLSEYSEGADSVRFELIQEDFNELDDAVYNGEDVDDILDVDAFARFMLTNDLVLNQELGHPKSTFLFKEELENPESKIKFGPLWDFDWGFGYESTSNYCLVSVSSSLYASSMKGQPGYLFFSDIMNNDVVKKYYYKVWREFLDNNSIEELLDYMDCYYKFAKSSFENNATVWSDGTGYDEINTRMQQWTSERAEYLYNNLTEYNIDEFLYPLACDVNMNNYITVQDVAMTTAYQNGNTHASFSYDKADVDGDGDITESDVRAIEEAVVNADPLTSIQFYNTPLAIGDLYVNDFTLAIDEDYTLPIRIARFDNENYKAVQLDITVPDGVDILSAKAAGSLTDHRVTLVQRDLTTYRLVVYSDSDASFVDADGDAVVNLTLNSRVVVAEDSRVIGITNALAIDEATDEYRLDDVAALFGLTTNIYNANAPTASVSGGDCITITSLTAQDVRIYSVDGRLVRSVRVAEGTTRVSLPVGIYAVLGTKVVVR